MNKQNKKYLLKLSRIYEDGCKLFEAGQYQEAATLLEELVEEKPREIGPYVVCAAACSNLGQYERAIELLGQAIEKEPDNDGIIIRKIYAIFNSGNSRAAIKEAEKVLEERPDSNEIMIAYASLCSKSGPEHYLKGAKVMERLLEKEPENTEALNCMGALHSVAGKYREAIPYFIKLLRLQPDHVVALLNVAGAFEKVAEPEMALNFYESLLKIDPNQGLAMSAKASILCNLGLSEENVDLLAKGVKRLSEMGDKTNFIVYASNYIFYVHYVPGVEREKIRESIESWYSEACQSVVEKPRVSFDNPPQPKKKLRIGVISNAFKRHPVTWMTLAAFENLNKDEFEIYSYSDILLTKRDDTTNRFYSYCDKVHETNGMSNSELIDHMRDAIRMSIWNQEIH